MSEINEQEFKAAQDDAAELGAGIYTHKFKKPFKWMDKEYPSLEFDFNRLTGKDYLAIESELAIRRIAIVVAAFSTPFLVSMASKASGLGADAFEAMSIYDFTAIVRRAKSFLLRAEL